MKVATMLTENEYNGLLEFFQEHFSELNTFLQQTRYTVKAEDIVRAVRGAFPLEPTMRSALDLIKSENLSVMIERGDEVTFGEIVSSFSTGIEENKRYTLVVKEEIKENR